MGRRVQRVGGRPGVHREVPEGAGGPNTEKVDMEEYLRYTKEEQKRQRDATSAVSASRVQSKRWCGQAAHHGLILREEDHGREEACWAGKSQCALCAVARQDCVQ
mmetsp:Transcript_102134/g.266491  ORF Transcript_102134/g.266491 Transcript_102134/m.266491 type:complete len:105 (+) Transcript_102134:160-474(+)